MVLLSHLFDSSVTQPGGFTHVPSPVRFVIHHGYLGVDLFFVLSGFLITGILLRTRELGLKEYFKRFYTRRALRILPLYFLVIALIGIAYGSIALPWLALASLMSANLSATLGVYIPSASGPFWSLAVEEQFYLVWPWLVFWLPARWLTVVTIAIFVAEPFVRVFLPGDIELAWYHSDGLAIGALTAIWFWHWNGDARPVRRLIVLLVATSVAVTVATIPYGGLREGPVALAFRITEANLLFAALIAAAVAFSGARALAILRSRPAVYTALLSYCLYVIHRPLMSIYETFAPRLFPAAAHFTLAQTALAEGPFVIVFAYAVAALSWRYFEGPILRRGRGRAEAP